MVIRSRLWIFSYPSYSFIFILTFFLSILKEKNAIFLKLIPTQTLNPRTPNLLQKLQLTPFPTVSAFPITVSSHSINMFKFSFLKKKNFLKSTYSISCDPLSLHPFPNKLKVYNCKHLYNFHLSSKTLLFKDHQEFLPPRLNNHSSVLILKFSAFILRYLIPLSTLLFLKFASPWALFLSPYSPTTDFLLSLLYLTLIFCKLPTCWSSVGFPLSFLLFS